MMKSTLHDRFVSPPPGYGEVSFYWWQGDRLDRERIRWQLDQLKDASIAGLQVNYAHSDEGGASYGLTYASDPPLFSEAWWDLFGWFLGEAKSRGMCVSLSDYTLGPGQGWSIDEVLRDHPEMRGGVLRATIRKLEAGETFRTGVDGSFLSAAVVSDEGELLPLEASGGEIEWTALEASCRVVLVSVERLAMSLDPMAAGSGACVADAFFGPFDRRFPGEAGRALNFFFSDELNFNLQGRPWNGTFAQEFRRRKGYDIVPELSGLFVDIGPRTSKVRIDYYDVYVTLSEENYFKPVFEWHERRGMTYGCDHGGRGTDVAEFGDYFRTQRWNQGPGCDQPHLGSDVIKNKVASSIAHLYKRPRTWLEGFYSSGWGTTCGQVVDATWRNFAMGHNLLSLHGLYYSTQGGWWEWAPPCNHFRMPYWRHFKTFLRASERMSYLLSQGVHVCDVAVLYPVELVQAECERSAARGSFDAVKELYRHAIDVDFMDADSLERSEIIDGRLHVAGESYRTLVIADVRVMRFESLRMVVRFAESGGDVFVMGDWPAATERMGGDDVLVGSLVSRLQRCATWGSDAESLRLHVSGSVLDFECASHVATPVYVQHRRIEGLDVYFVYGVSRGVECAFRARGRLTRWDPWTGERVGVSGARVSGETTIVPMPLEATEAQVLVFDPTEAAEGSSLKIVSTRTVYVHGPWEFEVVPTLDNRWGDYRLPASPGFIGPEVRILRVGPVGVDDFSFLEAGFDDARWPREMVGVGPLYWVKQFGADDESIALREAGESLLESESWQLRSASWRTGLHDDPGPQGYHGLKGRVHDELLAIGQRDRGTGRGHRFKYELTAGVATFVTTSIVAVEAAEIELCVGGVLPTRVWLDGKPVRPEEIQSLASGRHRLVARYDEAGTCFIVPRVACAPTVESRRPLSSSWFDDPYRLPLDPYVSGEGLVGWYRCSVPPGTRVMRGRVLGSIRIWVDGAEARIRQQGNDWSLEMPTPLTAVGMVAMRVEQLPGCRGAAVFPDPIEIESVRGSMACGDWAQVDGLSCYSGSAWYRRDIELRWVASESRVLLDLGELVASAELRINGEAAGVRVAAPWVWDITKWARIGTNAIEVLVCNTLSNHYRTIPTRYRGSDRSGLIGPVRVRYESDEDL